MSDPASVTLPHNLPPLKDGEDHGELRNMLAQKPYIASDAYLSRIREDMFKTVHELAGVLDMEERMERMRALAGDWPGETYIAPGFGFEYVSWPSHLAQGRADRQGIQPAFRRPELHWTQLHLPRRR